MDLANKFIINTFNEQELLKLFLILKSFNVQINPYGFNHLDQWGKILYITPHNNIYRLEHNKTVYVPYSHYTEITIKELLEYDTRRIN